MEILPEAGHTPQLEQVDAVAALVLDFVARKE
jgi:pimeloyl-ACP methyl ester carboxylesterase